MGELFMTIAFLFSGQGSQFEGMGTDLAQEYPEVSAIYKQAEHILGYNLLTLSKEQLDQTRYTQVAIYTLSCAIENILKKEHIFPSVVAGLSLGEYSALVCAESLDFEQGLRLLEQRALFMEEACRECQAGMLAILNDNKELIQQLCHDVRKQGHAVFPANYNAPSQIVVAGEQQGIQLLQILLVEHGIKRVIPLAVSGAFHTPLMQSAAIKLNPVLQSVDFKKPKYQVIGNTYAKPIAYENLVEILTKQIVEPVQFEQSIKEMIRLGANLFIEIGPKQVLSQFVKKIDKGLEVYAVDNVSRLQSVIQTLRRNKL
ncbi:ACP S-malonyltransferase [Granulicatella sp. 19428wC4_WM01]|nr:ACP S-malonyltransferase [Granulicatella sp. 19428wC4_WM01]